MYIISPYSYNNILIICPDHSNDMIDISYSEIVTLISPDLVFFRKTNGALIQNMLNDRWNGLGIW